MAKDEIPRRAIYRVSIYQRCLQRLKENEVDTVSSQALAKAAGVKPTQLRKDLAYFGQFGTRGLGYDVANLSEVLTEVLGRTRFQPVIIAGIGNLGSALLRYGGFQREGFEIVAGFDVEPNRVRDPDIKTPVYHEDKMVAFIRKHQVKMAILSVPASCAQGVANDMVTGGIQAILNFSPTVLEVPEKVIVNGVDLALELENLSYFIR